MSETAPAAMTTIGDITILRCDPDGPLLRGRADALDLIGATYGTDVELVVIPVPRLDPGFFTLATGIAGEIVQKFVDYRLRLVVEGDIDAHLADSSAVRAFVAEANRGQQLWFVRGPEELAERLGGGGA